jgi:hypothetical protein
MGRFAEHVHLQLEDEIVVVECGGPERGAGGGKLRGRQSLVSVLARGSCSNPVSLDSEVAGTNT